MPTDNKKIGFWARLGNFFLAVFLSLPWKTIGDYILDALKQKATKLLLNKVFGGVAKFGGFKIWLAKLITEVFWDYVGKPITQLARRKGLLVVDKVNGEIIVRKIDNAKENNDVDDYTDSIGRV